MKKQIIALIAMAGLTASVFGQGQVTMANNASTLVRLLDPVNGTPVPIGSMVFQLHAGVDAGSLVPLAPTGGVNAGAAGRLANTIVNVSSAIPEIAPGAVGTFQIWAWSSGFASYADALLGDPNTTYAGKSAIFTSVISGSGPPAPTPVSLAGKYAGFAVQPVPEPSTIALGILGAGSLLFLRRKK
jgi:hypothetical protein